MEVIQILYFYPLAYSLSAKGDICSEPERIPIDDLNDCEAAVTWIQSEYQGIPSKVDEEDNAVAPRGCYVYLEEEYVGIVFNTHSSGKSESESRQVCKEAVKGTLTNSLHMK